MPRSIFLIFLAFGVAIAGGPSFYYAWCWSQILEARTWPATQGIMNSVDVEEHVSRSSSDSRSTVTYYPRLAYSYRVAGSTLHGSRIWFTGNQFYNDREDADAFVRDYAVGQSVPVVYDPQYPADAALLVENPPWQILLATVFGLLWIGLSLFFRLGDNDGAPQYRLGKGRRGAATGSPAEGGLAGSAGMGAVQGRTGCIIFGLLFGGMWVVAIVAFLSVI